MYEQLGQKGQFLGYRDEHQGRDGAERGGEDCSLRSDILNRLIQHIKRRDVPRRRRLDCGRGDMLGSPRDRHHRKLSEEQRAIVKEQQARTHGKESR